MLSLSGCCINLTAALNEIGKKIANIEPTTVADFEMFQDGVQSYYFAKDYPVTFKLLNKENLDLKKIKFNWEYR